MMFLTETNLMTVAKTQYRYKIKANAGMFVILIAVQLLAFLLSLNGGVGASSGGSDGITYNIKYISGDIIIVLTLFWALSIGISTAGSGFKMDFTFISNRVSSHLSSIAFLLTAAVVGGVTATLCGILLRVVMYYTQAGVDTGSGFWIAPLSLLTGIFATILYAVLTSSIGYFAGMLVQRNRVFIVLLPVLFFGTLFVEARSTSQVQTLISAIEFFSKESSHALFALKAILVSALLYGCVILFSNRMEVRK